MAVSPVSSSATNIAVVGVSALFPGSTDATGFWRDILAGRDMITEVPESHWLVGDYYDPDPKAEDKTYCKRGAFLTPVEFDPVEHGIPPSIMPATDTSQLLALMVAKQVLEDATQGQFASMDKERVSVILGVTSGQELFVEMGARLQRPQWLKGLREAGVPEAEAQAICDKIAAQYVPWQESSFPGLLGNVVAGRIANRFDLGGTNCVTDAACASSLSALSMGLNELILGHSDMVIAGGVDTFNDISMFMCFSKTPALSPSGDCRPFSDQADGTIIGEGLTMLALKRLSDAERDGDRIYAVIKGCGTSSDGRAMSVYAPLSAGQAKALRRAYDQAGYGPETVELLEAHGTGTKAGDAAEFGGLKMVFGDESSRDDHQWCALGSVKSQIGHTKSTAGAAGLFKVVMALHHKVLPPTIKVDRPNPKLDIEQSPFYLNTQARPWVRGAEHARRASVSAFGFGGSNFHVTLEEYTGTAPKAYRARTMPSELVVLTAAEPGALAAEARAIAGGELPGGTLTYLARTSQEGFDVDRPARLAVVATDEADLAKKLLQAADAIEKAPKEAFGLPTGVHYAFGAEPGDVAFLFPGQGSQYVNMGADLAMAFDEARGAWDATRAVAACEGLDRVVFPVPVFSDEDRAAQQAKLTETQWAQPAIGAASLAQLAVLRALGLTPDHAGGHSFGELTALHAGGVLKPEALLNVGRKRGELMFAAGGEAAGTMAAVALSAAELEEHLAGWNLDVVIANDNSPKQVVISGSQAAIEEAEAKLKGVGATVRRLPVAAAFHSPLVADASEPFGEFLAGVQFGKAEIPVYANAEAAPYPSSAAKQRKLLASQIARPVRFVEMVQKMYDAGARTFVEVGPGSVLTGLVGQILEASPHRTVALDRKGQHGVTSFWHGLAQLAVAGVALDFAALWAAYAPAQDPRAKKKPAFSLPICGTNFGKVYPPQGGAAALPAPNPPRPVPAPVVKEVVKEVIKEVVVHAPAPATPVSNGAIPAMTQPPSAAADAFAVYQQALADSHMAYLKAMEATLAQTQMAYMKSLEASYAAYSGQGAAPAFAPMAMPAMPAVPVVPAMPQMPAPVPQMAAPIQPVAAPVQPLVVPPQPVAAPPQAVAAPVAPAAPVVAKPAVSVDLEKLMLDVVAEKTGYPVEMLTMEMALEADLGVDSIKRVEILSAVQDRVPNLPDFDASQMASLRTLGEIVAFMQKDLPAVAPSAPAPAPVATAPSVDLQKLMLDVVAEKTGYPVEMLTMEMALEADLGVDSIKRVEILSAVQDRAPGLPDFDASQMASLRTLGEIVAFMENSLGAAPAAAAPAPAAAPVAAAPAPAPAAPVADLTDLMLQVVAEKTGYPVEMLNLEMGLEADLGVDSIKRVEILSAVQDRAPGLPEFDAGQMASLRTLGQIVEFMSQGLAAAPGPVPAPSPAPAAAAAAAAPAVVTAASTSAASAADLTALMLQVVAEKTGYPAEMLNLEMALEADLGVDSIKRVEILSAVQDRAPGLPEFDAGQMASLRTLGQIVEFMSQGLGPAPVEAPAPAPVAVVAEPVAAPVEPVAEKVVPSAPSPKPVSTANDKLAPTRGEAHGFAPTGGPRQVPGVVEAKSTGLSLLDRAAGPVWVAPDGTGVSDALVMLLKANGFEAYQAAEPTGDVGALIDLGGLAELLSVEQAMAVNRAAFDRARKAAAQFATKGGAYVTVQDTAGDFGMTGRAGVRAWSAGLAGLAKTAAQEWPQARVRAIDVERGGRSPDMLAASLANELLNGGTELEVGLLEDGRRVTVALTDAEAPEGSPLLGPNDVVVASGGARGVTASTLIALAKACQPRMILLGRSPLEDEPEACKGLTDGAALKRALLEAAKAEGQSLTPAELGKRVNVVVAGREVRETLRQLRKAGSEALYLEADVRDAVSLGAALAPIRGEWGPITALVHGAGVLADKRLQDKTLEQFDQVFETKVAGLKALLAATTGDPLKAIVLFSSVAGRHGNAGQADYAMANEVLNKVAQAEAGWRGDDCLVKSLNWGPWAGGMVTPELAAHFEKQGVPLLPVETGAQMLVAELRDVEQPGPVEVLLTGAAANPGPGNGKPALNGTVALELSVGQGSHEFLNGHRIHEVPVVPAVMVLEWFLEAARRARPDLALQAVRDLKVLKGVTLEHFTGAGDRFSVRATESVEGAVTLQALELRGLDGVLHYAATVELVAQGLAPVAPAPLPVMALDACPWDVTELYGEHLFHTGPFRVVRTLEGVSREGLVGGLAGLDEMNWGGGPWQADVAMLDGGLQLARLWGIHMLGRPSLPTSLGEYRAYRPGPARGPVRCEVRARVAAKHRTLTDIRFLDDAGELLAELRGVEMHLLPEKKPAEMVG